ncbi:MAG: tetratricopeptide repeat protein [Caldilineaceae bacterium]
MAYSVESKANNPANILRDALEKAERQVVNLTSTNVEEFLVLLDEIEQKFLTLAGDSVDLRPEEARWDSLTNRLLSRPNELVSAASRAGGLRKLRAKHPPATGFWWQLDAEVARRRAQTLRRAVTTLVALVVILGGGWWAVNFFFPPSPEAVKMVEINSQLDQLIAGQQWADAMTVIEAAQKEMPDQPELKLWEVVFAERLGDTARAERALAEAQALLPNQQVELWVQLGNFRLQVGDLQGAEAAGQKALAIDPNAASATFLLGGVAEARNDIPTAIDMFNKTFDLAEQDNPQLAVIARVRMGNLLQRAPAMESTTSLTETQTITASATVTETLPETPKP